MQEGLTSRKLDKKARSSGVAAGVGWNLPACRRSVRPWWGSRGTAGQPCDGCDGLWGRQYRWRQDSVGCSDIRKGPQSPRDLLPTQR